MFLPHFDVICDLWSVFTHVDRIYVFKTKKVAARVSLMFLPHFDVLCDLLLNRPMATWNLFVLYNHQKRKKTDTHALFWQD